MHVIFCICSYQKHSDYFLQAVITESMEVLLNNYYSLLNIYYIILANLEGASLLAHQNKVMSGSTAL